MKLLLTVELHGNDPQEMAAECRAFVKALAYDYGFFQRVIKEGEAGRSLIRLVHGTNLRMKGVKRGLRVAESIPRLKCAATLEKK